MTGDKRQQERPLSALLHGEALEAASLGWELALPIFIGALAGYYLDRWLGTKPILTIALLVLGAVSGLYNVIQFASRQGRQRLGAEKKEPAGEVEEER